MCHAYLWNGIMGNHTVISLVSECDWAVLELCAPGLTLGLFLMHWWCAAHLSQNRSQQTFGHCQDRRRQMSHSQEHQECFVSAFIQIQPDFTLQICNLHDFKSEVMLKVTFFYLPGGARGHSISFFLYVLHIKTNCIAPVHLKHTDLS